MITTNLDLPSLNQQIGKLREYMHARRARLEADFRRAAEFDEKLRQLTGPREIELLSKVGVDMQALEAQKKEELQLINQDFENFIKAKPPEGLGQQREKERILRQGVAKLGGARTWILPPAYACEPGSGGSDVVCNATLAELNMKDHSSGLGGGWGWLAHVTPPVEYAGLWFLYWPSANGNLFIDPYVDIQGTVYVNADDHWYTSTEAKLQLTLWCNLYQFYWESWSSIKVVDENRSDSSASYWVDGYYIPSNSTTVVAGTPVWIYVEATLWAYGRSDYAVVDADFFSGAYKFIRIPLVLATLVPF